jgi:hypothetical protein
MLVVNLVVLLSINITLIRGRRFWFGFEISIIAFEVYLMPSLHWAKISFTVIDFFSFNLLLGMSKFQWHFSLI